MKGDFSRVSFNPNHGFTRVNQQQGRIQLDADANEQQAINLHLLRTLAADLIGPHGGTQGSFEIIVEEKVSRTFGIAPGRYYVEGWACVNPAPAAYRPVKEFPGQPYYPEPPELVDSTDYLIYLEAWERHLSAAEFDRGRDPAVADAIREVALDGVDTASRAQTVWQVRALPIEAGNKENDGRDWEQWLREQFAAPRGMLRAKAAEPPASGGPPCEVSPRARFRGDSDQLYRVEIRRGGVASSDYGGATFVWSRDNGAVAYPVETIAGPRVTLAASWRDARLAIAPGDIVELAGPIEALQGSDAPLLRVIDYDPDSATLTLSDSPKVDTDDPRQPVMLRRWDHGAPRGPADSRAKLADDNTLTLVEGVWLTLEDGIQVMFGQDRGRPVPAAAETDTVKPGEVKQTRETLRRTDTKELADKDLGRTRYQQGDYWLIPSRVALADVLGPREADSTRSPIARAPDGVERVRAPLALISVDGGGGVSLGRDLRRTIRPVAEPIYA
jgi:hypothetical protein